jgi:hypothetical protein
VSSKSKRLTEVLAQVPAPEALPSSVSDRKLIEIGFLCVLVRRLSPAAAEKTLVALGLAYPDWNELRVSQVQEFRHLVQTRSDELAMLVARDVREYLQEVFQKVHGFDLESLRGDLAEAARFASQLTFVGASAGHLLLHLACPDELPMSPAIVRTLDRLGLIKRTASLKKAQAAVEPMVAADERADFALRIGRVIENWCDAKKPLCWECPLCPTCPHGKKVEREWKATQRRLELQRQRDEERARKEAEKERKRAAAEEKRRLIAQAREDAKRTKQLERERARQLREAKARAAKAAQEKARQAKVKARQAKAKKVARKATKSRKTTGTARKTTARKTAAGKSTASRTAARKATARKTTARKTTARGKKKTTTGSRKKTAPKKVVHKRATKKSRGGAGKKTARKTTKKSTSKTRRRGR